MDICASINIYITWTGSIGQTHELTCPCSDGVSFQCPLITEAVFTPAELLIGANFTATTLVLKNVTSLGKDLIGQIGVQLQYGIADDPFPSPFPLFPNVHLRATLAMTHLQYIMNENIASLGLQKVGRDTRNISQCR